MKSAIMATASLAAMVVSTPALASTYGASVNGNTATNDQVGGVCFYADINYAGKESCYVIKDGELSKDFDLPSADVNTYKSYKAFGNVTIKALDGVTRATSQYTTFFGNESSADMGAFKEKMDFITIEENTVCLYRNNGQTGDHLCYDETVPTTDATGTWSSYRAFGNRTAIIYANANYAGSYQEVSSGSWTGGIYSTRGNITPQSVSSIDINIRPAACLYTGTDFTGTEFCYFDEVDALPDAISGQIRSVRAPGDYDVWLYKNANFTNAYGPTRRDSRTLDANRQVGVGLRVLRRDEVCFYHNTTYEDHESCFTPNGSIADLSETDNDEFSSVVVHGKAAAKVYPNYQKDGNPYNAILSTSMYDFHGYDQGGTGNRLNDNISAVAAFVDPRPSVCFFREWRYSGSAECVYEGGENSDFDNSFIQRNSTSGSLNVGNRPMKITAYSYQNFSTSNHYGSYGLSTSSLSWAPSTGYEQSALSTFNNDDIDSVRVGDGDLSSSLYGNLYRDVQREDGLGNLMPFVLKTKRASHNTFNAQSFFGPDGWGEGANQWYDFATMKDWGVRVYEMDTGYATVVCHLPECPQVGKRQDIGVPGMELKAFVKNASKRDFMQLYYEAYDDAVRITGPAADAAADWVYFGVVKPVGDGYFWESAGAGNCSNLEEISTSTEAMINRGKRLLIYVSGNDCNNLEDGHNGLRSFLFKNNQSGIDANNIPTGDLSAYGRVQETNQLSSAGKQDKIVADNNIQAIEERGAKYIAMDRVVPQRVANTRWAWESEGWGGDNDSLTDGVELAAINADTGGWFRRELAGAIYYGVCRKDDGTWFLTSSNTTSISNIVAQCQNGGGQFDVPLNAYEKKKVKALLTTPVTYNYIFNYRRVRGQWTPGVYGPLSKRVSNAQ